MINFRQITALTARSESSACWENDNSPLVFADKLQDGKLHFWELVEATPLPGGQSHSSAVLCVAFFEETLARIPAEILERSTQ